MFKTFVTLHYDPKHDASKFNSWWLKADFPRSIADYYRYWIKRELGMHLNTPLWKSHVTVIRGEEPRKPWNWKKHEGRKIEVSYSPEIKMSETYAWLAVESKELEAIRVELGLTPQPRVRFHATLGNTKGINQKPKKLQVSKIFPWENNSLFYR